jgi:uncharacterized membrane protein YcaP (DUF421 family)
MVGLGSLFAIQMIVSNLRGKTTVMSKLVDNTPLLLMRGTKILHENLKKAQVTHDDLRSKLREANVTQMHQIHAVIMEDTGDISVMHNDSDEHALDDELLQGVRGW